ncbi:MAG: hypothetical protein WC674_07395 [Candidatus Krumholzibacteriia bacterium]
MNTKLDIENLLERFRSDPSPRVKRAVLSKYAERCGRTRGTADATRFWRRSVPLHFAAILIVVAAGLSFVGGQALSRREGSPKDSSITMQDSLTDMALEQQLYYAPNDLF